MKDSRTQTNIDTINGFIKKVYLFCRRKYLVKGIEKKEGEWYSVFMISFGLIEGRVKE